ncbi:hypothetical protein [Paraconexibacter sp.]|uniref:hypothetical protein n=1 Tax=Paraconexibacter sp. TaxID=2949640 RepID=UPI0035640759
MPTDPRNHPGRSPLVASGATELAAAALTGWVYTLCRQQPDVARSLGIKSVPRIRQWHLDLAALGTASIAAGLAAPDASRTATNALRVGAWTNAMAFLPLAFKPDIDEHPAYIAAVTASFTATTVGFCGIAAAARRARRTAR